MKFFSALGLLCLAISAHSQSPVWTQFGGSPTGTTRNDDIFFANPSNGWSARGTDGVYRTINGGQTWIKVFTNTVTTPLTAHFRSIGFASATRGWTGNLGPGSYDGSVNDTNLLYETSDGGTSWSVVNQLQQTDMKGFCAIHVYDSQRIYGVGRVRGPAHFTKTEDGGTNWWTTNLTTAGVMGGLMDVYFKDPTNGFIVGMDTNLFTAPPYYGSIARTTNGGLNWQVLVTTTVTNSYFWKMSWPTPQVGYASLQQNNPHTTIIYYKTTDGGATWFSNGISFASINIPGTSFGLQGIGFISTNEGWMGGSSSLNFPTNFIHTTNGGASWTLEGYNNTRSINRIRFVSPTLGWMSGQQLHVYKIPLSSSIGPINPAVSISSNVTFTSTNYGNAPFQFQWRLNGVNLANATNSVLTLTNVQATNAGNYDFLLTDFSGSVTSAVSSLTVNGITLPPTIVLQPQNTVANLGSNASFTVTANGTSPLRYQWFFNDTAITGATNSTFTRTNVQPAVTGNYFVTITNSAGRATSSVVVLTLGFVDDFDSYSVPVIVTNAAITNGYRILFGAASGPQDFKAIFGFDYSTVTFPTNIPPAPRSIGGSTRGLYLAVNKDATAAAAAVNLYPLAVLVSNNFTLRFDCWLNWTNPGSATEHALFGINHSGNVTNRLDQPTSDGLFFAMDGDGNVSSTSLTLRDFAVLRGGGAGAIPILMITNNTAFGPTPPLGKNFDAADLGFVSLFPSKNVPGYSTPAGTPGLGWVSGEIRQVGNLVTWLLNGVAIAQYTNNYGYTNGTVLIGYNDAFSSIGSTNNFVIFDNLRVENYVITAPIITAPQLTGSNISFSLNTDVYDSYTIQWSTNLAAQNWSPYTNFIGNGATNTLFLQLSPSNLPAQFFRVTRP